MKRRTAIVQPWLLAALLAIGTGVVLAIAWFWSLGIAEQLFGPKSQSEYLVVRSDGTPLIASSPSVYGGEVLRTLDGVELPDEGPVPTISGASLVRPRFEDPAQFPLGWQRRILAFTDDRRPPIYWYFIHDGKLDGSGYFVGYDSHSKARVGYIGLDGFRSDEPPAAERIPVDGRLMAAQTAFAMRYYYQEGAEPYYGQGTRMLQMASENRILEIDLRQRSVRKRMEYAQILGLNSFARLIPPPANVKDAEVHGGYRHFLAVRIGDHIIVTDIAGRMQRSYPLPEDFRNKSLTFWEISDGEALIERNSRAQGGRRHELCWIDTTGKITRQGEVVLKSGATPHPVTAAWVGAAGIPAPLAATIAVPLMAGQSDYERDDPPGLWAIYTRGFSAAWPPLIAVLAVAVVMAGLCYRRQKRYAQPWTAAWVILVLLGGVPGLVGYLLHRRWPVLEKCPTCRHDVPHDREACAKCGIAFPAPEPKGCEVFA
jgi:hypothetical protein